MPVQPTPHNAPSPVEQEHIKEALGAAQSAMDAIGTVTDIASYTLTILGVFIAILALWGVAMIIKAARDAAERIANNRMDDYIAGDDFQALVKERVDKAIAATWQDVQLQRLTETGKPAGDEEPFPAKDDAR
jgi:hypothetical protein